MMKLVAPPTNGFLCPFKIRVYFTTETDKTMDDASLKFTKSPIRRYGLGRIVQIMAEKNKLYIITVMQNTE